MLAIIFPAKSLTRKIAIMLILNRKIGAFFLPCQNLNFLSFGTEFAIALNAIRMQSDAVFVTYLVHCG